MADAAAETSAAIANDVVRIGSMVSFFNPNVRSHCARGERQRERANVCLCVCEYI
jgi:hypothetical protein